VGQVQEEWRCLLSSLQDAGEMEFLSASSLAQRQSTSPVEGHSSVWFSHWGNSLSSLCAQLLSMVTVSCFINFFTYIMGGWLCQVHSIVPGEVSAKNASHEGKLTPVFTPIPPFPANPLITDPHSSLSNVLCHHLFANMSIWFPVKTLLSCIKNKTHSVGKKKKGWQTLK
jgi:hypothetical protein